MRIARKVFVPLVALATAAAFAASAGAALPRPAVVAETVAMVPSPSYPWVQPLWIGHGSVVLPGLPSPTATRGAQPPAWVPIQPTPVVAETAPMLASASYPWVQPLWTSHGSVVLPMLPSLAPSPGTPSPETQPPARIPIT